MVEDRKGTVCFLRKNNEILLALIEYTPNDLKWNGIGGFVEKGESLEDAVVREGLEETYIEFDKKTLRKVAELYVPFQLSVFVADKWNGELKIREPSLKVLKWFSLDNLPYSQMHEGTKNWLPKVLNGKLIRVKDGQIEEVERFDA